MAKKLIATRPIQYMGRTYATGEVLPAYDARMTEAWLKHGSAKLEDNEQSQQTAGQAENQQAAMDPMASAVLQTLDGMGVKVTDDAGEFCGEEELTARIAAAITEEAGDLPVKLVATKLDANLLARLKTEDLEKLAADLGASLEGAKNNTERAERIAAVEILIPAAEDAQ